jgi:hypothetical protein
MPMRRLWQLLCADDPHPFPAGQSQGA